MKHTRVFLGLLLVIVILCTTFMTGCTAPVTEIPNLDQGAATAALDLLEFQAATKLADYQELVDFPVTVDLTAYAVDRKMTFQDAPQMSEDKDWTVTGIALLKDAETKKNAYTMTYTLVLSTIDYVDMITPTFKLKSEEFGSVEFIADLEACTKEAMEQLFPEQVSTKWGDFLTTKGAESVEAVLNKKDNDWVITGTTTLDDTQYGGPSPVSFTQKLQIVSYQDMKTPVFEMTDFEVVPLLDEKTVKPYVVEAATAALLEQPPEDWKDYQFDAESIHLKEPALNDKGVWVAEGEVELQKDGSETITVPVTLELEVEDYADLRTPILTVKKLTAEPIEQETEN